MLPEDEEWLWSPYLDGYNGAFSVIGGNSGYASYDDIGNVSDVRPTLYLESSVQIAGGNGSQANPYKLN
jgi:hypothetical protein